MAQSLCHSPAATKINFSHEFCADLIRSFAGEDSSLWMTESNRIGIFSFPLIYTRETMLDWFAELSTTLKLIIFGFNKKVADLQLWMHLSRSNVAWFLAEDGSKLQCHMVCSQLGETAEEVPVCICQNTLLFIRCVCGGGSVFVHSEGSLVKRA